MADTVEKKIYQALLIQMQAFVPPAGVTIVMPGQAFTPTAQSKFVSVEVHFNRSVETDLSLVLDPIRQGFMRTNVMWPKGSAIVDGYDVAGQLRQHVRRGTKLFRTDTQVRIDEDPEIGVLVTGDTHHNIPVTTRWRCYPQVPA
ncbi:phage tail terminator-like protein [Sinorhizobium fredii]|uniref:Bacteriophage-related domain-containing protein n=1 Tax=Rhizobium fredii TaxID=380 RepID=A0A2L0H4K8_RHIFR|nr:phage tail terminator-like protein [Sinorhizobium fredii]AUX76410.1 bacteriophage-related domain-containing protein [Sinorhizobium fredii]